MKMTFMITLCVIGLLGWAAIFIALSVGPDVAIGWIDNWSGR